MCPLMDEQMSKMWFIHIMEYLSVLKRMEILQHTTTQYLLRKHEDIVLSEIAQ